MSLIYVDAGTQPSNGPTPGIENWKNYVLGRWPGGMDLGTWGVRNKRGSNSLSVHAVGRAWDCRYAEPGPGRATADEAIAVALADFPVLGIQAIHDYVNCTIWRCSRGGSGPGWKNQTPGNGMGDPTAKWLHWEVHPDAALHSKTVAELLTDAPHSASPTTTSTALPAATLRVGDAGPTVAQLQQILNFWTGSNLECDGRFGPRTEQAVKDWQVG